MPFAIQIDHNNIYAFPFIPNSFIDVLEGKLKVALTLEYALDS